MLLSNAKRTIQRSNTIQLTFNSLHYLVRYVSLRSTNSTLRKFKLPAPLLPVWEKGLGDEGLGDYRRLIPACNRLNVGNFIR